MPAPTCPNCHSPLDVEAFLRTASGWSSGTDSASSPCPACRTPIEFRVLPGRLELGYTYWAGALHFEAVSSHRLQGLRRVEVDGQPGVTFGERTILIGRG